MDLVSNCKDKLTYFRIKELKEVLTKLGLSKQGKKQDLVERILSTLSDDPVTRMCGKKHVVGKEEVANIIEDAYRKVSGATELATKVPSVSDTSTVKPKEVIDDSYESDSRTRCPCGSSLSDGSMIKCEDPRCEVWQHLSCVIIPEKPSEGDPALPQCFYCEICRLNRADPFWVTLAHPLNPVKLNAANAPTDGSNPVQSVEKTFQLSRADKDLLIKQDYDVQAWCMLLNDKVPFRMQWPQYADLQVNGMPIRAINRPGSQLLGANGRDDGPIITPCIKDGINKISLSGCDSRIFCMGVRTVKRRNVQQILNMIPVESKGEPFEDALARVRRCVNGGASNDNADSDSDLEVVADSIAVNLRCPMSGSRMKVAGRFKPCLHMGCFDLHVFVEMNQRSRKWQCPICLKNYALENVIIDPYFNLITTKMLHCGEDVTEVEVKPDGAWRVKTKTEMERRELGNLVQWHLSDGSLYVPPQRETPKIEDLRQVKQEGLSDGHPSLKLEIKKNSNGLWQVRKPEDLVTSSGGKIQGSFEQKIVRASSSATESGGRHGEDPSVNQDGGGIFDISTNNGIELDSVSLKADPTYDFGYPNSSSSQANPEIVVLSDSDEDEEPLISSGTIYNNGRNDASGVNCSVPPSVSYSDNPTLGVDGTSCVGLYNANDDEYGIPLWPLPVTAQTGPGLQLFGANAEVSEMRSNMQHNSMNGYTSPTDTALGSSILVPDSSIGHYNTDMNNGLVDNPMTFVGEDPSLQIFLPTRPSNASEPSDVRDRADVSNGIRADDWISLRLGGGASSNPSELPAANGLIQRKQLSSNENASLLGVNDGKLDKTRERSDSPFSFPRQKRSVRQRLYLSIDSDTD